jgi:hypothetical protein
VLGNGASRQEAGVGADAIVPAGLGLVERGVGTGEKLVSRVVRICLADARGVPFVRRVRA